MATDISKLGVKTKWQDLTEGMIVAGAGTSKDFLTGEWSTRKPEFMEDKCKQCLLCVPVCPDSSIPVKDMKRGAFDYDHCKGCGICVKACPFGAITMPASPSIVPISPVLWINIAPSPKPAAINLLFLT